MNTRTHFLFIIVAMATCIMFDSFKLNVTKTHPQGIENIKTSTCPVNNPASGNSEKNMGSAEEIISRYPSIIYVDM